MAQKKYELATDIAVSANTYAGELALPYLTPAVKTATSVANGYVTSLDAITSKAVVSSLTAGTMIKASACDWDNDPTTLTLKEKVLTTVDMMVNERVCRGTIYPTWVGRNFNGRNGAIPSDFATFLMSTVAGKTAEEIEDRIWIGGALPNFTGFLSNDAVFDRAGFGASQLVCGASSGGYVGAGLTNGQAITATGSAVVNADLGLVYDKAVAQCSGILGKSDTQFLVNAKTYGHYMMHLANSGSGQGVNMQGSNQSFADITFLGIPVNVCTGMPDDCIILCQASNLFFGTNLGTDTTEAKMIPFYEYDGSDNVGISMRFQVGVQVGVPENVVVGAKTAVLPA